MRIRAVRFGMRSVRGSSSRVSEENRTKSCLLDKQFSVRVGKNHQSFIQKKAVVLPYWAQGEGRKRTNQRVPHHQNPYSFSERAVLGPFTCKYIVQ